MTLREKLLAPRIHVAEFDGERLGIRLATAAEFEALLDEIQAAGEDGAGDIATRAIAAYVCEPETGDTVLTADEVEHNLPLRTVHELLSLVLRANSPAGNSQSAPAVSPATE